MYKVTEGNIISRFTCDFNLRDFKKKSCCSIDFGVKKYNFYVLYLNTSITYSWHTIFNLCQ